MSIPTLNVRGELPPGEHEASWEALEKRFGAANGRRRALFKGLRDACALLAKAGVRKVWIDGSFVTSKENPNDIDAVWGFDAQTFESDELDPIFLGSRAAMKKRFGAEFFPDVIEAGSGKPFPVFFQTNRSGEPKGIIVIRIGKSR